MKKIRFSLKSVPLMLLVLTILTYGLLIPWIGFYWDDWNFAWISHFLGAGEFIPAFQPFRPFLGPIFTATTSILHESTIGWQLFGLLVRFLLAFAVWWSLNKVWSGHTRQVLTVSLFVLVFPGYGQQSVAFTHINQELIPLLAYLFSFGVTALALRSRARFIPLTLLSLALTFLGLFTTEYFIGLEIIRFFLIMILLADASPKQRILNTIKHYSPYLLLWLANAAWLTYYYRAGGYHSYGMQGFKLLGTGQMAPALLEEFIGTLSTTGFAAWFQIFRVLTQPVQSLSFWLSIGLVALSFGAILFYLLRLDFPDANLGDDHWALQALGLGLLGIIAGRIPSWVAGLPLSLDFSWDRFMLSMMLGACLFLAGLIELLIKSDARKFYLVALVLALSVAHQFNTTNSYRRDWDQQKSFFWQLSWRIPAMQPGTILITHELPIQYESDLSLSAPLNWIYAPKPGSHQLDYILLFSESRFGQPGFPALLPNQPVDIPFRTASFHGSTSNAIVFYFPAQGCLKVFDPVYNNKKVFANLPYQLTNAIPLSDPSRIQTHAAPPALPSYFGSPLQDGWCYFYEKAELARQDGDWSGVAKLGRQAAKLGLVPEDDFEWLPFIEAYARTADVNEAGRLSLNAAKENPLVGPGLCALWDRMATAPQVDPGKVQQLLAQMKCQAHP